MADPGFLLFFFHSAAPGLSCSMQTLGCGTWDLVPWPRDWTQAPCIGSIVLATGPPGKFLDPGFKPKFLCFKLLWSAWLQDRLKCLMGWGGWHFNRWRWRGNSRFRLHDWWPVFLMKLGGRFLRTRVQALLLFLGLPRSWRVVSHFPGPRPSLPASETEVSPQGIQQGEWSGPSRGPFPLRCSFKKHGCNIESVSWPKLYVGARVHSCFSRVWLFATSRTVACQGPLSMGFSQQEYWSGLPCPPPGDLPDPGIKPLSLRFPALAGGCFSTSTSWEAHMHQHTVENFQEKLMQAQLLLRAPVREEMSEPPYLTVLWLHLNFCSLHRSALPLGGDLCAWNEAKGGTQESCLGAKESCLGSLGALGNREGRDEAGCREEAGPIA